MIKKTFFGLIKPRLECEPIESSLSKAENILPSKKITLLLNNPTEPKAAVLLKERDNVKTGQKISLSKDSNEYVISTVTGNVSSISHFTGYLGKPYTSITINIADNELLDEEFKNHCKEPTLDASVNFLNFIPGSPPFNLFADPDVSIKNIIVCGFDTDLLVKTNQYIMKSNLDLIKTGIRILKKITGVENIILAVPQNLVSEANETDATVKTIKSEYPGTLYPMVMRNVLGFSLLAGRNFEDSGVCFFTAEAVASMGYAFSEGRIPMMKTLTLIKKDGSKKLVSAKIGTAVSEILKANSISLNEKDRLIFGGPMQGVSIYSEEQCVQPDTDAVLVQDRDDLSHISDYPCINCGECIRICPANIPVNLLVRFLESGLYEEGADHYDLLSCIECGLCSYVCVSRIPIMQYIKLAKYELDRTKKVEAANV